MTPQEIVSRFHQYALVAEETATDADSLIGFFQTFRPDGKAIAGLFDDLDCGVDLHERLDELYAAAGDDRRPQGGRDAYFVVRQPKPISPDDAEQHASKWLKGLSELASELGVSQIVDLLNPLPAIRVLEGTAPKNPKIENEKCELLVAMQSTVPELVTQIAGDQEFAEILRPAFYFTVCDSMVRDHLMWPLYATRVQTREPFAPYFQLWKHRVKYRIFNNRQIDLYLPRHDG